MSDKGNFGVELAKLALILDTIGSYQKSDPIYHYTSPQGCSAFFNPTILSCGFHDMTH